MVIRTCLCCGKTFNAPAYKVRRGDGKFCSLSCTGKYHYHEKLSKFTCKYSGAGENNAHWMGGIAKDNYRYAKIQKMRFPEHVKARKRVYNAIKYGKLVKGVCEVCGSEKTVAHHDDYSKPLLVRWFCRKHHRELHGGRY